MRVKAAAGGCGGASGSVYGAGWTGRGDDGDGGGEDGGVGGVWATEGTRERGVSPGGRGPSGLSPPLAGGRAPRSSEWLRSH